MSNNNNNSGGGSNSSSSSNEKIKLLREIGVNGSDDEIIALLKSNNGDIERVANIFFGSGSSNISKVGSSIGSSKSSSSIVGKSSGTTTKPNTINSITTKPNTINSTTNKPKTTSSTTIRPTTSSNDNYIFIGRRNIDDSYTLNDCYVLRYHSLRFKLEISSSSISNDKSTSKNVAMKKDKFSGIKQQLLLLLLLPLLLLLLLLSLSLTLLLITLH